MVEDASELPVPPARIERLYADFETSSGDRRRRSTNPWRNCYVAGVAVAWDDVPGAWYVPLGHAFGPRVCPEAAVRWWRDVLARTEQWVNHNVKYDMHVSALCMDAVPDLWRVRPRCTLTWAKLIDSDRTFRGGYGLDALSLAWLGEDIRHLEAALAPYLVDNKDWGMVPADVIAPYGGQDVMTTRRLDRHERAVLPGECDQVAAMEDEVTAALFEMERVGLRVERTQLIEREVRYLNRMLEIDELLTARLGRCVNPVSSRDCFDVLCNQFGLPVLAWTEEGEEDDEPAGNPSFDKDAMKLYASHPYAPKDVVALLQEYKKKSTHLSLFVRKYQEQQTEDGLLHSTYNQLMRTGRLGSKEPNAQQLDKDAKELVLPPEGGAFLSMDQSQIEFRVIVEYIRDRRAMEAYARDPDTDFHEWMAGLVRIDRRPAKTMNFMMGYGGGKKKTVKTLKGMPEVLGDVRARAAEAVACGRVRAEDEIGHFERLCVQRAEDVYDGYHRELPTLKRTSYAAADACRRRGYVFNMAGRRRHLPPDKSHHAFNTLCQGFAADIQKACFVELRRLLRGTPVEMSANVHDETLFQGPAEVLEDHRVQAALAHVLERARFGMTVPLRVSSGLSRRCWREASCGPKDGGVSAPFRYTEEERAYLSAHGDDPLEFLRRGDVG
jgi:DNA polymerase-1